LIKTIQYGNSLLQYSIIRSNRRKTSEIIVGNDGIVVRAPFDKPLPDIEGIVEAKKKWIFRKRLDFEAKQDERRNTKYANESGLFYLGRNYPLKILSLAGRNELVLSEGVFTLESKSTNPSPEQIRSIYLKWLRPRAVKFLDSKVRQHSEELKVSHSRVVIKNLKNRWGSATKNGVLNINVHLMKAPERVIDYIVLHELCHLRIKNHSHRFWQLLRAHMPDYQERKEWLESNSSKILD
jgi:predicted metal-dependent hydrolase